MLNLIPLWYVVITIRSFTVASHKREMDKKYLIGNLAVSGALGCISITC